MSPWAPEANPVKAPGPQAGSPPAQPEQKDEPRSGPGLDPGPAGPSARPVPAWVRLSAFVLSGLFFLSGVLIVFAPLPILFARFKSGRGWAWLCAITNAALVAAVGGHLSLAMYSALVLALALVLPELLLAGARGGRKISVEGAGALTLLSMGLVALLWLAGFAQANHTHPFAAIQQQVSLLLDAFIQKISENQEARENLLGSSDVSEWKQAIMLEIPWRTAVFSLILVWLNLTVVLRLNPGGIRERLGLEPGFARRWKAPEWLVWPTIAAGFLQLADLGAATVVGFNVLWFLMAVYAIQGMSILSFFFDVWNVRGLMRSLGFLMAVFLMLPLLVGLGFFDQWFDFRAKLRQS